MSLQQSVREFCAEIGKDPLLVQGAGGNVSWKENDVLWVKASGTWLADANEKDIFVPVKLDHLSNALKGHDYGVIPQTLYSTLLKPSIETLLHALMPHRIVVHLHAIEVLAHLVRKDFDLQNYPGLDQAFNARTVAYCKPGAELAEAIAKLLDKPTSTQVVFLKNHGVIVGGDDINEIRSILEYLSDFFRCPLVSPSNYPQETKSISIKGVKYYPITDQKLHELVLNTQLINQLNINWALYPDHIVFLGAHPFLYDNIKHAKIDIDQCELLPDIIFIKDRGVFTCASLSKAKIAQLECYYNVIARQVHHCQLATLTDNQIAELIGWEAEKYRMRFAK
jgi:rhamnose utilization protein RhaD (predicted bifunctional aldolase and dehydrogenase)